MSTVTAAQDRWRHQTRTEKAPVSKQLFPAGGVVGQVKPHNEAGIRGGVNQLRDHYNRNRGRAVTYQLLTYRKVRTPNATRYAVLLADPVQLGTRVRSREGRGSITTWYRLGYVDLPEAATLIPVWQCPPRLGNLIEPKIRERYQSWMRSVQGHAGLTLVAKDSASSTKPDIQHEVVAFLRELAAELEAELGS